MIHGAGQSAKEFMVLHDCRERYRHQVANLGENTATNKHLQLKKTEVNDEELNAIVKRSAMAALKGRKKKFTCGDAADIGASSEDDVSCIVHMNLEYLEW